MVIMDLTYRTRLITFMDMKTRNLALPVKSKTSPLWHGLTFGEKHDIVAHVEVHRNHLRSVFYGDKRPSATVAKLIVAWFDKERPDRNVETSWFCPDIF